MRWFVRCFDRRSIGIADFAQGLLPFVKMGVLGRKGETATTVISMPTRTWAEGHFSYATGCYPPPRTAALALTACLGDSRSVSLLTTA